MRDSAHPLASLLLLSFSLTSSLALCYCCRCSGWDATVLSSIADGHLPAAAAAESAAPSAFLELFNRALAKKQQQQQPPKLKPKPKQKQQKQKKKR